MTIVLGSLVILLTLALGALLAFLFSRLDRAVVNNYAAIDAAAEGNFPALTMGFDINPKAPADDQIAKARKEAAKLAAALPRGANSRIGYTETPGGNSAYKGVDHDPWTAAKIAEFHGWDGVKIGIPAGGVPEAPVAAAPAAAAPSGKIELVPGKDYPYIEITDDMSDEDKRKARIANSKAKSAAMKAAKAAGVPAAAAAVTAAPAVAAPAAVGIEPPKLIEISDDMPDEEKRKARIANSKAKSAFNKALKTAGIDPKTVEIDAQGNVVLPQGAAPLAAGAAPAAAAPVQSEPAAVNIEAPALIEITDDMPDDEKRKARIANSKAKSTFNKALKAAGIDPKTVEITEDGKVIIPGAAAPAAVAAAEPVAPSIEPVAPAEASGEVDLASLGLEPPKLVEITDDMSPDEKRQARIANSKAKSAFNKALKAAGVDPKSVDI
jgi:uncharacterized protein YndB with AHSA1/START domain